LRRWTAPHPDWTPDEGGPDGWERDVGCLVWEAEDALVLIDPLVPEALWPDLDELVSGHARPVAALLTVFWHSRSADQVRERYGARVFATEASLERVECEVTDPFRVGAELPGGLVARDAMRAEEVVYWIPERAAVVAGDVLLGHEGGVRLCPPSWLGGPEGLERARASLRGLLDLPIELLLVSHGEPVLARGRETLAAALS
jgi:glyoxylase-like metal-dependent hydrolase (beta-lactamase superfamily II)